jgi:hypothetical protein
MKYLSRLGHCTIALLILLLLTPHPATITAAPLYNVIDVPCEANGAVIGLAIEEANDNPGLDTINLAANCTYSLTFAYAYGNGHNGLPLITDDLIIEGNGSRLERATAIKFRLMQTSVNVPLTIKNLTMANGYTDDPNDTEPDGGAVYAGAMEMKNSKPTMLRRNTNCSRE